MNYKFRLAILVNLDLTLSPILTSILASSGRNKSTLDPNFINPSSSPLLTGEPFSP